MTYQGMINYSRTFGKHTVATGLGVIEARERNVWNMSAKRLNYNINIDEINAEAVTLPISATVVRLGKNVR